MFGLLVFYGLAIVGGSLAVFFAQPYFDIFSVLRLAISAITLTGSSFSGELHLLTFPTQFIVLILIQLGAFAWVVFVLQFANIAGLASIFSNKKSPLHFREILLKSAGYLLLLEAFSAISIYVFSMNLPDVTQGNNAFFYAVFNGISIFCHSGFTLMKDNFFNSITRQAYIFQLVLVGIIILGNLGYASFFDLTSIKRLRQRLLDPNLNWTKQTRLAIYGTAICISAACMFFYLFESSRSLSELKIVAAGITVFFNSVNWFGAGYYSLPAAIYSPALQWFVPFFMLLGSASGAFSVLGYGIYYYAFRRKKNASAAYKALAKSALAVLIYSLIVIIFSVLILTLLSHFSFKENLFHSVSAFTNTGLVINEGVSGNYWFYLMMLLGRIGVPLVALLSFARNYKNDDRTADENVMLI